MNGAAPAPDRFGLLWRPEHAAELWRHLDEVDVVEVIAEDWFARSARDVDALRSLARQVPVRLHGVSLGAASTEAVAPRRLDQIARLVNRVEPEAWSEHLAFVRGGGVELGHLCAPSRRPETAAGAIANLRAAARVAGTAPLVENAAALGVPPASTMDETEWTREILDGSGCGLLLDLHNLHANERNCGTEAAGFIDSVTRGGGAPREIHIAGGRWTESLGSRRLVDDHLHDVPRDVFALLARVAARTDRPLTVILERDGAWPGVPALLAELGRARDVVDAARRGVAHAGAAEVARCLR